MKTSKRLNGLFRLVSVLFIIQFQFGCGGSEQALANAEKPKVSVPVEDTRSDDVRLAESDHEERLQNSGVVFPAEAGTGGATVEKILVAGDSWAVFACRFKSLRQVLKAVRSKVENDSRCLKTSRNGIQAQHWETSEAHQNTVEFLRANKHIRYLYLSLGGNDLLNTWTKNFAPAQELQLFQQTFNHLQRIMRGYIAINPLLKIILSGYDFPHFKPNHPIKIYRDTYEHMLSPSDVEINGALIRYSQFMTGILNNTNIFYIHHLGLVQYYDGIPEDGVAKEKSLHPNFISTMQNPGRIGGYPLFHASEKSMILWALIQRDAFHVSGKNFDRLMLHTYNNVLVNIFP